MAQRRAIAHIDLHLVKVLHTVISERSVSRAASRLQTTQPMVSAQLKRLRQLTGDALLSDLKLAALVMADPTSKVEDLSDGQLFNISATADREEFVAAFEKYDRVALPVTDSKGVMLGIITIDDVLDVAEAEATEDIQKLGGMQALEAPYMDSPFLEMVRKRAGWLLVLFFGEMFTATAMAYFEGEIKRAVVLALFIPLIISSGGNSGSQATSLIIRSLAVREHSEWRRKRLA